MRVYSREYTRKYSHSYSHSQNLKILALALAFENFASASASVIFSTLYDIFSLENFCFRFLIFIYFLLSKIEETTELTDMLSKYELSKDIYYLPRMLKCNSVLTIFTKTTIMLIKFIYYVDCLLTLLITLEINEKLGNSIYSHSQNTRASIC